MAKITAGSLSQLCDNIFTDRLVYAHMESLGNLRKIVGKYAMILGNFDNSAQCARSHSAWT